MGVLQNIHKPYLMHRGCGAGAPKRAWGRTGPAGAGCVRAFHLDLFCVSGTKRE
jgi:hypothetical protein